MKEGREGGRKEKGKEGRKEGERVYRKNVAKGAYERRRGLGKMTKKAKYAE